MLNNILFQQRNTQDIMRSTDFGTETTLDYCCETWVLVQNQLTSYVTKSNHILSISAYFTDLLWHGNE